MLLTFADGMVDDVIFNSNSVSTEDSDSWRESVPEDVILDVWRFDVRYVTGVDVRQRVTRVKGRRVSQLAHAWKLHITDSGITYQQLIDVYNVFVIIAKKRGR